MKLVTRRCREADGQALLREGMRMAFAGTAVGTDGMRPQVDAFVVSKLQ